MYSLLKREVYMNLEGELSVWVIADHLDKTILVLVSQQEGYIELK